MLSATSDDFKIITSPNKSNPFLLKFVMCPTLALAVFSALWRCLHV